MDYPKLKKKNFFNEKEKFVIQKAEVNMESELHSHEFIEIAYVLSGSGRHKIEEIAVSYTHLDYDGCKGEDM